VSTFLRREKVSPPTHSLNNPKIIIPITILAASSPDLVEADLKSLAHWALLSPRLAFGAILAPLRPLLCTLKVVDVIAILARRQATLDSCKEVISIEK
jgi:hypothetical protein